MLHCDKGLPLSEAVRAVVCSMSLTAHHLKRIQESANVKAYLLEYDRKDPHTSDGTWVRYVSFRPAIFEDIMDMLSAKPSPGQEVQVVDSHDYETEPEDYKVASMVSSLRLPDTLDKVASEENTMPKVSLDTLYSKLGSAIERMNSEILDLQGRAVSAENEFMALSKQAVMADYSLGDIRKVAAPRPTSHLDRVLNKLAHSMKSVFWTDDQILGSFEKVSAKRPTPEHPITLKYAEWVEALNDLDTATRTRDVLSRRREEVLSSIRELKNG